MNTTSVNAISGNLLTPRDSIIGMGSIRWKLNAFLTKHGLTAYRLATTLDSHTRAPTIYRLAREDLDLSRIDFNVLATVIDGLRELTGEDVDVTDLLEYRADAEA